MNSWIVYSIITGICFGFQTSLIKYLSSKLPQSFILAALFLTASIIIFPFAYTEFSIIDTQKFIFAFSATFILNLLAFYLLVQAITSSPISVIAPYLNLTPLFMVISGYFILNEILTQPKILWIIVMILGAVFIQYDLLIKREFLRIKNTLLAITVAFIWSITASLEKICVKSSTVFTYAFLIHLILGLSFFLFFILSKQENLSAYFKNINYKVSLLILGGVSAIMAIYQYKAIILTLVADVIAFKRAGVIISSFAGYIFFKEKHIIRTLIGAIIIIIAAYQLT